MTIKCYSFFMDKEVEYEELSKNDLKVNEYKTFGKQYDKTEEEVVEGIVPLAFKRLSSYNKDYYNL